MNTRILPLLFLVLVGCGNPAWTVRTAEPCASSLGDRRSDQERAYLATLLALSDRRYEIVVRENPRYIEATVAHLHADLRTTWVFRFAPGGVMTVDQPENDRETHDATRRWYDRLMRTIELYRCRDIDWLRWNAENRGLVPMGEVAPSGGGEVPSNVSDEVPSSEGDAASPSVDVSADPSTSSDGG